MSHPVQLHGGFRKLGVRQTTQQLFAVLSALFARKEKERQFPYRKDSLEIALVLQQAA